MESNGWSFPRTARLTTPEQYQRVFAEAIRVSDQAFTLLAIPNQGDAARLGLAISKKCARHAVQRNRIKRLARESFRLMRAELPCVDVVVLCRPAAVRRSSLDLTLALNKLWRRLEKACAAS